MDDETNALLREIRDLLTAQEARYEVHRAETRKIYDQQIRRQLFLMLAGAILFGTAVFLARYLAR